MESSLVFCISLVFLSYGLCQSRATLELVVALFRHGDRTPEVALSYPKDPYINETYAPYGSGQLTNKGKQRMHSLGKKIRKRYDEFLGQNYNTNIIDAISTNMTRTKKSLEFLLQSLFPSKQLNEMGNFPFTVVSFMGNRMLSLSYFYCPRYRQILEDHFISKAGEKLNLKYKSFQDYISVHSGINATSIAHLTAIYHHLVGESEWGFKLPTWTLPVYPIPLKNAAEDFNMMLVATPQHNQLQGGFLLKKMIRDIHNKINRVKSSIERKMYIYSGHDTNIVGFLGAMNLFYPHTPEYGACVFVELHQIHNSYYIQVLYDDSIELKDLIVPNCTQLCPLKKFEYLLRENMPDDGDPCASEGSENVTDNILLRALNITQH